VLGPYRVQSFQKYTNNKAIKNIIQLTMAYLSLNFMGLRKTAMLNALVSLAADCQTTKDGRTRKKSHSSLIQNKL